MFPIIEVDNIIRAGLIMYLRWVMKRGTGWESVSQDIKKDSYQQADERFKYYLIIELVGLNDKRSGFLKYKEDRFR